MPEWPRQSPVEITKNDLDSKFFEFEKRMDTIDVKFNEVKELLKKLKSTVITCTALIIIIQLILFVEIILWRG